MKSHVFPPPPPPLGAGSGATTTHVFQTAGNFNVTVTVSNGDKSATGSTNVAVRSLGGSWRGQISGGFSYSCNLLQSGPSVGGNCSEIGGSRVWTIAGAVSSPLGVRLTASRPGYSPWYMTGNASSDINSVAGSTSGLYSGGVPVTPGFTLVRQ